MENLRIGGIKGLTSISPIARMPSMTRGGSSTGDGLSMERHINEMFPNPE